MGGRPVAWVGFAHDAGTGRASFEAFVAASTPFAREGRASFLGKAPATVEEMVGKPTNLESLAGAIAAAYAGAYGALEGGTALAHPPACPPADDETPWRATVEEAIGVIGAGPDASGAFRLGGELLASRDAIEALERALASLPAAADEATVARAIDATLGAPGAAVHGLRSLSSVLDVVMRARA